jgi:hypothetical protein
MYKSAHFIFGGFNGGPIVHGAVEPQGEPGTQGDDFHYAAGIGDCG